MAGMTHPLDVFRADALAGHVAVITGGGTGICRGIAAAYARFGCDVCIVSRKADVLAQAATELSAATGRTVLAHAADVRDPDAIAGAIEAARARFGKVDTLINGAAGNFLAPAAALTPGGFRTVVDIDLNGSFLAARAAFPALRDAGDGLIVNITATLHYHGTPLQIHASAAKAGVDAITRNLAVEWGGAGVRVVSIAPGPIGDTEGIRRLAPGDLGDKFARAIPMGRFGTIDEIAATAVFLRSAAAAYITGTVVVVDGGQCVAVPGFMAPT
jgi:peroxisomal 2,4-dienoyl-CoA reductase